MDLKLDKVSYDGEWFNFGDMRVKVRPYPASKVTLVIKDGAFMISGEQNLNKFQHCLVEWENTEKLTNEVKRKVFDFRLGKAEIDGADTCLADFVIQKADELFRKIEAAEKN
jgi:hypothetical protein